MTNEEVEAKRDEWRRKGLESPIANDIPGLLWSHVASQAYDAYGAYTDHKNFMGGKMPEWKELPQAVRTAWECAVRHVWLVIGCSAMAREAVDVSTDRWKGFRQPELETSAHAGAPEGESGQ